MKRLIAKALAARERAYAPYSRFRVGAALEGRSGRIYTGCNVENASYGAVICAERTALFKAVSEGERSFKRIVVIADTRKPCPPCGICRQALFEFEEGLEVIMANMKGAVRTAKLSDLLPNGFRKRGR